MKSCGNKHGLTLLEVLIVIAIIAILTTIVIGVVGRVRSQADEQLTESTLVILSAALEQFRDYDFTYQDPNYSDFDFPIDCNGLPIADVETTLKDALGVTVSIFPTVIDEPNYSGCEVMYFLLSKVPDSRKILNRIDSSLITSEDSSGNIRQMTIDGRDYPLLRVIDPWGETLRYDYYTDELNPNIDNAKHFPVVISAGPDGIFENDDDISSR
ncbi:MAG: prepilin-type N-terminal cleavage/methylation domain-containing protein [Planctomycetes bacterium]|nr:prepilin-type N-terminal cleavage/methylation domain-containing protein [Planctomycetota bacterium]